MIPKIVACLALGLIASDVGAHPVLLKAGLSPKEITQVNEGGLVVQRLTPPDDEGVSFRAVKRLPVSLASLKPVLTDCQHFKAFMPHTIKSDRTNKAPNKALCDVVVDLPFPFDDLRSLVLAEWGTQENGSWQRKWSLVSGSFYRNEGRWVLVAAPESHETYILYEASVNPKVSIPDFILSRAQVSSVPDLMDAIVKRTQSLK